MLRRFVPALAASVIRGAMASMAATSSLNFMPTEEAVPPAFSTALFRYGMSAEPCWDAAARMFMYSAAWALDCPIWFSDPVNALAAVGTSSSAASASVTAASAVAVRAVLFFNSSGICEPMSLYASTICVADCVLSIAIRMASARK